MDRHLLTMSEGLRADCERAFGKPVPVFDEQGITLYQGDAISILPSLPCGSVDVLLTDPPYCSGAGSLSSKQADPVTKYSQNNRSCGRPTFTGDAKDSRSFQAWCWLWLTLSRRLVRPGGYGVVAIDWRMLGDLTDAFQAADWAFRGIAPWDKGAGARAPHKGYLRHQCEYWVWGTHGALAKRTDAGPFPGCYQHPTIPSDKHHLTGKPVPLMRELVQLAARGETVLDPFCGSGTTLVAAALEGRRAIGIEREAAYCEIAIERIRAAQRGEVLRYRQAG